MYLKIDSKELRKALQKVRKEAPQEVMKKTYEMAKDVEKKAKEKTPVKTGLLKKSYMTSDAQRKLGRYESKVSNKAPHFHLIERGHKKVTPGKKKNLGWVDGYQMLEKSVLEKERVIEPELIRWLKKTLKDLEG